MQKELIDNNPILKKTIEFSLVVIEYCELLDASKKYIISKQLLRSATSIGANAMEAQNAESKADFIHKLKMADKEAKETLYWMDLLRNVDRMGDQTKLRSELDEIMKLLNSIICTSRKREKDRSRFRAGDLAGSQNSKPQE